ncbi:MAG TPA: hypothetical protein VFN48_10320 [Solirubrobacteraceae bacterium]|nr:hypothetical protein [Solirubrobacteraceae bacterium]
MQTAILVAEGVFASDCRLLHDTLSVASSLCTQLRNYRPNPRNPQ